MTASDEADVAQRLLAEQFEACRPHLRSVAYRMLGSRDEADDAVQEAWLRLQRNGSTGVDNLGGWLTAVVGRVCLDMLRRRRVRGEVPLDLHATDLAGGPEPEPAAVLHDAVGAALLVVLDTLTPPERLAFVLHDVFAVPFADVAAILDRSPAATRQLASRARRRVQGVAPQAPETVDTRHSQEIVQAFLAAARGGDFAKLLAVLDPHVALRADAAVPALGGVERLDDDQVVASAFLGKAQAARAALLDGAVGAVFIVAGRLRGALEFVVRDGRITAIDVVSNRSVLDAYDLVLLDT